LRETTVGSNFHFTQVVYPNIFSYPGVITHLQLPGILNSNARFDDNAIADSSAKHSKQCHTHSTDRMSGADEKLMYDIP
jgi:hypothetical protein